MFGYLQSQILSLKAWFNAGNSIITMVHDVNEKNYSSSYTVDPIITLGDDGDDMNDRNEKNKNFSFKTVDRSIIAVDDVNELPLSGGDPDDMASSMIELPAELYYSTASRSRIDDLFDLALESTTEEAENITQSDASISYDVVIDEVKTGMPEIKEAGVHALLALDMCSTTAGIDELIRRIASLSLGSTAKKAERITQSDATIRMQSTLVLQMDYWIQEMIKPDQFQSGWLMIETLASFAVSKASLWKRHDALLLPSAIIRITLEFFASRNQLQKPLNSQTIERLRGVGTEHVPLALELLDCILSDEMVCLALTEKMKDAKSELRKINHHMWMSQS